MAKVEEEYIRAGEVARRLHCTPETVCRWSRDGRLPYMKTLGGHRRYEAAVIDGVAERLTHGVSA
jgi:excisionase family DNA binding protein